jgi:UDP-glucose 4-epimerase
MRVCITGNAGLIGSRLADWIIENHPEVTVYGIDDLSGGFRENINPKVKFSLGDVSDPKIVKNFFELTNGFDIVYHFACYAAECVSPFIRNYNYTNNLVATANIVNECIRWNVGRLVFTSSMAVYGNGTPPFTETDLLHPIDSYGNAKRAACTDIQIAGEQHGLDWCIIRPHNFFGKKQSIWDSYRNVIGIFIYKGMIGDPLTVYGDGLQTRAFSEMTDALKPLWRAGTDPCASKQIINLGGIKYSTILDAAHIVKELSGSNIIHLPPRHEVRHAYSTWQKSVDLLGFEHKTELYDGIKNMWEWALLQPKRKRFIWSEYEIDKGLYPQWKPAALEDGYWKDRKNNE